MFYRLITHGSVFSNFFQANYDNFLFTADKNTAFKIKILHHNNKNNTEI